MLVAVLMLSAIAGLMVQMGSKSELHPSETPVTTPVGILYTTHSPISINGNGWFTTANGVVSGNGTSSDPYIIADWDINASTTYGVSIMHTNVYFIIRDCYIHDGVTNPIAGIYLFDCVNGTVSNNSCSNNVYGIEVAFSRNITVSNNTCSSNHFGGINLYMSLGMTLSGNILINNGIFIEGYGVSQCTTHDIGTSNTVNGKPVYYYKNQSGITVPAGAGEIILANCTDFIIENQNLSDATVGTELAFSSNVTISNNDCSNNYAGILLWFADNNTLSHNNCSDNVLGLDISYSNNNTFSYNNCSNNSMGIRLFFSNDNTLSNNNYSSNDMFGMVLVESSHDNNISGNQVCNNTGYGVYIVSGSDNGIWNNTFIGNNGATDTYDASHAQACDNGTNDWWNSTDGSGNYWSDWTTPDVAPPQGKVDLPYNISGSAGAKDYYPLTTTPPVPIPELGMMPLVVLALMAMIVHARETRRRKKGSWP